MICRTAHISCAVLLSCAATLLASAKMEANVDSTGLCFQAGVCYASGAGNVLRQVETNYGFARAHNRPIGLQLSAYNRVSRAFAVGGSIGPGVFFKVKDSGRYYNDSTRLNYVVPVTADVRYFMEPKGWFAPYARAGVCYPISGGSQVGAGSPGLVGALGASLWRARLMTLGLEAGYDSSKVKIKGGYLHQAEKVRPTAFTVSVFAAF